MIITRSRRLKAFGVEELISTSRLAALELDEENAALKRSG